jgi:hypothetical protein
MLHPDIVALRAELAGLRTLAAAIGLRLALKANFNPAQLRVPGGQPGGGRWTVGGERSGYPVDLLEEDALGGHTFERHVNKPDEYLKARILGSRRNIPFIGSVGEKRAGSFASLEAANKLVNSTLSKNQEKMDAFVQGRFSLSLPFMYVHADFDSPTGYEAYAPNDRSQPTMRSTYGVTALVIRSDRSEKGYYVLTAYPTNRD